MSSVFIPLRHLSLSLVAHEKFYGYESEELVCDRGDLEGSGLAGAF